jgi:Na+/citrate or Na+/malate symporter
MDIVKSLIGGGAVFSFLWFAVAIFYIMLESHEGV